MVSTAPSGEVREGDRVEFRPDTPQYAANAGIIYVVTGPTHIDRTHGQDRPYVFLTVEADMDLRPSRHRRRTGYLTALRPA